MADPVATLVEMGFSKEKAELAISKSGSEDVQEVMEWIFANQDSLDVELTQNSEAVEPVASNQEATNSSSEVPTNSTNTADEAQLAKSIRCDDCGKLFSSSAEVEFHASKSGHENFSESTEEKKPLSDDEKREQLAKIEAKLKQRRMEREAKEKEEELLREKNRIKSGKELLEAKKKQDDLEMKKIIEQRKRDKEEERLARQKVKEQIEQDKLARKAKFGGGGSVEAAAPVGIPQPATVPKTISSQNCTEVKLQIKLTNGSSLIQTFGAKEPLSAVRLYVEIHRTDPEGPFTLMTSFPRRVFTNEDYEKPLEMLGLAPSATIIVSKM